MSEAARIQREAQTLVRRADNPLAKAPHPTGMRALYEVARKDFLQQIRTKRVLIVGLIMLALLLFITLFIGRLATRTFDSTALGVSRQNFILALYFAVGFFGGLAFTQIFSILMTADGVCSEWANKTVFLLLARPVSRFTFITGKLLGNVAIVSLTLAVLLSFGYLLLFATYPGHPSYAEVAGFFGMLGVIVLGAAAYAAFALFISSLSRSITTGFMLSLGAWLVLFPLLGAIGPFSQLGSDGPVDSHSIAFQWSLYLNPASCMQASVRMLVPSVAGQNELDLQDLNPLAFAPDSIPLAILALCSHIVFWYGLALLVVKRRNFE